jgi:cation diffusion facilitator CzcD-associated flavoprotein CzcO
VLTSYILYILSRIDNNLPPSRSNRISSASTLLLLNFPDLRDRDPTFVSTISMGSRPAQPTTLDVIIVGAGIAGVNSAYRLQTELPNYSFTILEGRDTIGGTWSLFKYPGLRSDSNLNTFGFTWNVWKRPEGIAKGSDLLDYIHESASKYNIDKKIQFKHKVVSSNWSSDKQLWELEVDANGDEKLFTARFIIFGTGYYDYNEPLKAIIPGISNFKGQVVHPQFWPEDLDYTSKKMVIIGSGATAITIFPIVAEKAAKVTILQRSPSYVIPMPQVDPTTTLIVRYLPHWLAFRIVRWRLLILSHIFFLIVQKYPDYGRKIIKSRTKKLLPAHIPYDPNFTPSYGPWDQRLCISPDGDFYRALREKDTDIVTDTIDTVTENGILTTGGKVLDADIIVTATGLKMRLAGGAIVSVDGKVVNPGDKFLWNGLMLQDVPNAAFVVGYPNAAWTLGADVTAAYVTKILKYMDRNGKTSVTAKLGKNEKLEDRLVLNLSSTYIKSAKGVIPKAASTGPWRARTTYMMDILYAKWGGFQGLEFGGGFNKKV